MSYHFKHQISHPNPTIGDKVNFFADYFDYTVKNYGKATFLELENHKSLLEKIKFQLENFSIHSTKYINYYFKNSYLTSKDLIINKYYKDEWQKLNKLKIDSKNFQDLNKRNELKLKISAIISKLDKNLFKQALDNIIRAIHCHLPLEKHNHVKIFKYYTPIIVSEFIFAGFPKNELLELWDKILSKDLETENNKIIAHPPLPKKILKLKKNSSIEPRIFYMKVANFLKKRTLKQQFEGIYHIYKNSLEDRTYIFRLSNIVSEIPITLKYNQICISNELKNKYVKRGSTRKEYREFFSGKGRLFAEVTIKENNIEIGKTNALLKTRNALNFFNAILNKDAKVFGDDCITIDSALNVRERNFNSALTAEDINRFEILDPHIILKRKNILNIKFLLLDEIFFQAVREDRKELRLVLYWRYLESFFEDDCFNSIMYPISRTVLQRS